MKQFFDFIMKVGKHASAAPSSPLAEPVPRQGGVHKQLHFFHFRKHPKLPGASLFHMSQQSNQCTEGSKPNPKL